MKSAQEKIPGPKVEKTTCLKDGQIASLFEKHALLIGDDRVFQKIFQAINNGWENLENAQKQRVLDLVGELIEVLKDYSRAYTYHKEAAKRQRAEDYQTLGDYQAEVKRADRIEYDLHNRFIDSINILSRKMKAVGLDNSWRSDDEIYGLTAEAARQKVKNWMFKLFREKI